MMGTWAWGKVFYIGWSGKVSLSSWHWSRILKEVRERSMYTVGRRGNSKCQGPVIRFASSEDQWSQFPEMRQEIDRKSSQRGAEGWILEDLGFFSKKIPKPFVCVGGEGGYQRRSMIWHKCKRIPLTVLLRLPRLNKGRRVSKTTI